LGPRTWEVVQKLKRRGTKEDERGAEMIEFAIVVVLLITLLYGIITYGMILAAQATVTQAAADASRSGLVASASAVATAEAQANTDIGWMSKDADTCYKNTTTTAADPINCTAVKENCPSNASIQCLAVTVTYNYSSSPLFPELPGLGLITPSTISSTNVVQLGTVS
jgi:Flp pilus assembly protein TadG